MSTEIAPEIRSVHDLGISGVEPVNCRIEKRAVRLDVFRPPPWDLGHHRDLPGVEHCLNHYFIIFVEIVCQSGRAYVEEVGISATKTERNISTRKSSQPLINESCAITALHKAGTAAFLRRIVLWA